MKVIVQLAVIVLLVGCATTPTESPTENYDQVNLEVFPKLTGEEEDVFFVNKSIADQLPMDCVVDEQSMLLFTIGTSNYNSGDFSSAEIKFNEFFWDAAERNIPLSQRTIDWVLMWRAYSLSDLLRADEAQYIHDFRLAMMEEKDEWVPQLPKGIIVNEVFLDQEKTYVTGVIYEELSYTNMAQGQKDKALESMKASLEILSSIEAYEKGVKASLLFMQNNLAMENWNTIVDLWESASLVLDKAFDQSLNKQDLMDEYLYLYSFYIYALTELGETEKAAHMQDELERLPETLGL